MGNSKTNTLVRIDNNRFLRSFDGRYVESCDTPSLALFLTYEAASDWIARLRKRGYPQAVATDLAGNVWTYERLKAQQRADAEAPSDLPTSWTDLDSMSASELRTRYKVDANFAAAVDAIYQTPRPKAKKDQ